MVIAADAIITKVAPDRLAPLLAPDRTMLVIIDVQRDFAAPDGLLGRVGVDLSAVPPALDRAEALIAAARHAGVPVLFILLETRPETDSAALRQFMMLRGEDPDTGPAICRAGTEGAEPYRLLPQPGDLVVRKILYSAFSGSDLAGQLRAQGRDTLVLTGLTTDCCVDCNARDAFHADFHVFLAHDACAAPDADTHWAALNGLSRNCATILDSDAILAAWAAERD